jgi:hypothetical protein
MKHRLRRLITIELRCSPICLSAAKSRRNPACPKADFQWRDRLDLETRLLLNERVDRQSNGACLQIYASRMAESQALFA